MIIDLAPFGRKEMIVPAENVSLSIEISSQTPSSGDA